MNRIAEIARAWGIALRPNEEQTKQALERMMVCDSCGHKTVELKCDLCNCPLKKKVYSPKFDACPAGKWTLIDLKWKKTDK